MALSPNDMAPFLGWAVTGDIGPYTWYTRTNGTLVWFPKYELDGKIKTPARAYQRLRFVAAAAEWKMITNQERTNWQTAADRTHVPLTGYNLWVHWHTLNATEAIQAIEHQSGITLLPPSTRN